MTILGLIQYILERKVIPNFIFQWSLFNQLGVSHCSALPGQRIFYSKPQAQAHSFHGLSGIPYLPPSREEKRREECNKNDMTADPCFWLVNHNDWSSCFVISTQVSHSFALQVLGLWVGLERGKHLNLGTSHNKAYLLSGKSVIAMMWLLLPVSDWSIIMISLGALLLVVSHLFVVPILGLWVGLEKG